MLDPHTVWQQYLLSNLSTLTARLHPGPARVGATCLVPDSDPASPDRARMATLLDPDPGATSRDPKCSSTMTRMRVITPINPAAQAFWVSWVPSEETADIQSWRMWKLGQPVSPLEVIQSTDFWTSGF